LQKGDTRNIGGKRIFLGLGLFDGQPATHAVCFLIRDFIHWYVKGTLNLFSVSESMLYVNVHLLMSRLHQSYFDAMMIDNPTVDILVEMEKQLLERENNA
jgi:hypothetical protein